MISDAVLKAWREERMENVSGKRSCWKGGAYALENVEKGNWSRNVFSNQQRWERDVFHLLAQAAESDIN